jgi:hypothetical protein
MRLGQEEPTGEVFEWDLNLGRKPWGEHLGVFKQEQDMNRASYQVFSNSSCMHSDPELSPPISPPSLAP